MQGIKPAAVERFGVGDTDMTSQLNKMKAAGVDTSSSGRKARRSPS